MATNTATAVVVTAGTITFINEWYQTKTVNWRVPVATVLLGAGIDFASHVNENAAIGLSVMVLIAALVTKFNGHSVADTIAETFDKRAPAKHSTVRAI